MFSPKAQPNRKLTYIGRSNTRCSSCERPAWRRHGSTYGWGRDFICTHCLEDLYSDTREVRSC